MSQTSCHHLLTSPHFNYSPHHWLSEVVEAILNDTVKTNTRPLRTIPATFAERRAVHSTARLSVAPFREEFEVAAALWQPLLPFQIVSPRLISSEGDAIGKYQFRFELTWGDPRAMMTPEGTSALGLRFSPRGSTILDKALPMDLSTPNAARDEVSFFSTLEFDHQSKVSGLFSGIFASPTNRLTFTHADRDFLDVDIRYGSTLRKGPRMRLVEHDSRQQCFQAYTVQRRNLYRGRRLVIARKC